METFLPKLSVLVVTYNRANMLQPLMANLFQQSLTNLEIILVDNGSTDETGKILQQWVDHPRVRLFRLDQNRGWARGYNFALDQIRGEWFAVMGDDDRLEPHAFETMLRVVEEIDPSIDAVTANTMDLRTGALGGLGLDGDQYLPVGKIIAQTSGEFFGITKTSLLGEKRYNEKLVSDSDTFYYKIDAIANRYYIHQPLKTWGSPGANSTTYAQRKPDARMRIDLYRELLTEKLYWELMKEHNSPQFIARCLRGLFFQKLGNHAPGVQAYAEMLKSVSLPLQKKIIFRTLRSIPQSFLNKIYRMATSAMLFNVLTKKVVRNYSTISNR